jgi:hypothetical protein
VLVVDRLTATHDDALLVAHLAADEPAQNAQLVACLYLNDERSRCCRRLNTRDLQTAPTAGQTPAIDGHPDGRAPAVTELLDERGHVFQLEPAETRMSIPELRWWQKTHEAYNPPQAVSVREVIGTLESYEPVRDVTAQALAMHACGPRVSMAVLRAGLAVVPGDVPNAGAWWPVAER